MGFYVVTPIPDAVGRPESEDTKPVVWVSFRKGDTSVNEVLLQVRQVAQELKKRPLADLRDELVRTGCLSVGPFFPNDAEALVAEAFRRGIGAGTHRADG
jgi:hypothetical protein